MAGRTQLDSSISDKEIDTLIKIYCNLDIENIPQGQLKELESKNLIKTRLHGDKIESFLTEEGIELCEYLTTKTIQKVSKQLKEKMDNLPKRVVAFLIKRVIFDEELSHKENFFSKQFAELQFFAEELSSITRWYDLKYERVLLMDRRIESILGEFNSILKSLGLIIEDSKHRQYYLPGIGEFLMEEYKDIEDIDWKQEKSLALFYFFLKYHKGTDFVSEPTELSYPVNSDLLQRLNSIGVTKKDIKTVLNKMQKKGIVKIYDRSDKIHLFPPSTYAQGIPLFTIKDPKKYNEYITSEFLTPVADDLLQNEIDGLLSHQESETLEFKTTLKWDVKRKQVNKELLKEVMKEIVAFLNNTRPEKKLVIGVTDDRRIFGIEKDLKTWCKGKRDVFEQTLANAICQYIGPQYNEYIGIKYENKYGKTVCIITVKFSSKEPAYFKGERGKEFLLRIKNRVKLLDHEEAVKYICKTWKEYCS